MNELIEFVNSCLTKSKAEEEKFKIQEFYEKNREFYDLEFTDEELTTDM